MAVEELRVELEGIVTLTIRNVIEKHKAEKIKRRKNP
jgi:hypothetical protein